MGIDFQHESLDSAPTEVILMSSKKNCGCGQDPCKTYGAESFQNVTTLPKDYIPTQEELDGLNEAWDNGNLHFCDESITYDEENNIYLCDVCGREGDDMIFIDTYYDNFNMNKPSRSLEYNAETYEDSWEKGVIRLAISSGCFSDEYAEWVERQIDGPSATLNNPRYKEIIDKRWGLNAETFESESYNKIHGWATNMRVGVNNLIEDLENGAIYDLDDCRERLEKIRDDMSHLDAESHRDSKGRFTEKPVLTGSVIGGLALGLIYFMGRK